MALMSIKAVPHRKHYLSKNTMQLTPDPINNDIETETTFSARDIYKGYIKLSEECIAQLNYNELVGHTYDVYDYIDEDGCLRNMLYDDDSPLYKGKIESESELRALVTELNDPLENFKDIP